MRKSSGNRKRSNHSAPRPDNQASSVDDAPANAAQVDSTDVTDVDVCGELDMMARFEQLDAQLQLPNSADHETAALDRARVEEIADSNRQILQAVANQGDAISQLATALSTMRETLQELTVARPLQENNAEDDQDEDSASPPEGIVEPWEQIKNAILESHEEPVEEEREASQPAMTDDNAESSIDAECVVLFELVSQEDINGMDENRLRTLVIDQERIISRLARRVHQKSRADLQLTPDQLQECAKNLPEELAVRVEATLQTLDEQARLGELELSLERARISRQLSQLDATREILESNARHMGLEIGGDGRIEGGSANIRKVGSKGRRWLGALGFSE